MSESVQNTSASPDSKKTKDFLKLLGDCIPAKIKLKEDSEPINIYLRALTYPEELHVSHIANEIREWAVEKGLSEASTKDAITKAIIKQRLYFSARTSWEENAPKLFHDEREVAYIPLAVVVELMVKYSEAFTIDEDTLGESLRARTSGTK